MSRIKGPACRQAGFTLVELLVVMGVIGVLATVVSIMAISNNFQKGRDARRKTDLEAIRSALELYKNDNGVYPPPRADGTPWTGWCTYIYNSTYPQVKDALVNGGYLSEVPQDPVYRGTNQDYFYRMVTTQSYLLVANMEVATGQSYDYTSCTGGSVYNYELTNP